MSAVTIYGNDTCAYCAAARMLLAKKGIKFRDVTVSRDPASYAEMKARSGRTSVPQVFVGDRHVGGFDDLCRLNEDGELDRLLAAATRQDERITGREDG